MSLLSECSSCSSPPPEIRLLRTSQTSKALFQNGVGIQKTILTSRRDVWPRWRYSNWDTPILSLDRPPFNYHCCCFRRLKRKSWRKITLAEKILAANFNCSNAYRSWSRSRDALNLNREAAESHHTDQIKLKDGTKYYRRFGSNARNCVQPFSFTGQAEYASKTKSRASVISPLLAYTSPTDLRKNVS